MMSHVSLLFLYFLQGCLCIQTWEEEPSYTEVNPKDDTVLACKIFNKRGTCSWQKDGKPQGIFENKIEWAGDRNAGDCSLRVYDASEIDDGNWECQVTASSFSAHDALTSNVARLVVRVAPDPPQLELGGSLLTLQHNFTVREGHNHEIKCISKYGNPPARIKWFLGSEEISSIYYNQTNGTEIDRPKTFQASSVLRTSYTKNDHTKQLRCVAVHEAYGDMTRDVSTALNVQYAPTVTLQGNPTIDIEDGKDRVALQCLADANPPASIIWKRVGEDRDFSFKETIEFNPVLKKHSGRYTCKASNNIGVSDPLSAILDIKFPPRVLEVVPQSQLIASLNNRTKLECQAEGNPFPAYEWVQVGPRGRRVVRGGNSTLIIENVTYDHQGQYFCKVKNVIKGNKYEANSKAVNLEVIGAPQVMRHTATKIVEVLKGDNALIQMEFCSDPQPSRTTWEWGSLQLHAGKNNGRYVADTLALQDNDCYHARLRVEDVSMTDARNYYLKVENEKGADRYAVALSVKEPVSMTTVIGIVVTCLVILVIVTLVIFYAFKAEKCCFSQRGDFKPTDLETNRNEIDNQKSAHGRPKTFLRGKNDGGTLVGGTLASIPPDALYLGAPKRATSLSKLNHDYENIKTLQVPMAIQSTSMVTIRPTKSSSCSTNSTISVPSSRGEPTGVEGVSWKMDANPGTSFRPVDLPKMEKDGPGSRPKEHSSFTIKKPHIWNPSSNSGTWNPPSSSGTWNHSLSSGHQLPRSGNLEGPVKVLPTDSNGNSWNPTQRYQPGNNSPRKNAQNVVYAQLQLPRASNRGSLKRGVVRPFTSSALRDRTQYAEINFQGQKAQAGQQLQSAHI